MRLIRLFLPVLMLTAFLEASVIFSEDFNSGVVGQVITSTSSPGTDGKAPLQTGTQFEVVSGSVDMITAADAYFGMCLTGTPCVDMTGAGTPRAGGEIRTVNEIFFDEGDYSLSIDLQGWKDFGGLARAAKIQVLLPGLLDVSFVRDGANNAYPPEILFFTVAASTSVKMTIRDISDRFDPVYGSRVSSFAGAILDNVEIVRVAGDEESVPEPSTYLLISTVLGGLALSRWRRRAA